MAFPLWLAEDQTATLFGVDSVPMTVLYESGGVVVRVWRSVLDDERRSEILRLASQQAEKTLHY